MVKYAKSFDDEYNRLEFLLCDFPYIDGNDLLVEIFISLFGIETIEKFDGIWFIDIKARKDDMEYVFVWHEDVGNCVYCLPQNRKNNKRLENELKQVLEVLNDMIKKAGH